MKCDRGLKSPRRTLSIGTRNSPKKLRNRRDGLKTIDAKLAICTIAVALLHSGIALAQVTPDDDDRARANGSRDVARNAIRVMASQDVGAAQAARSIPRIVNGEWERISGQWAWTVSVLVRTDDRLIRCGGVLVAPSIRPAMDGTKYVIDWVVRSSDLRWVITAAHCVTDPNGELYGYDRIEVRGGTLSTSDMHRTGHKVENGRRHPGYNDGTLDYDLALLRISDPVNPPDASVKMHSIRLPPDSHSYWLYKPYSALTVHGWGRTAEGGPISERLQKVVLPVVDSAACKSEYEALGLSVSSTMFCAGFSTGGYDSCSGDSGGPISFVPTVGGVINPINEPVLAGIVSWGRGCARQNMYGVYTNVLKLRTWLESAAVELSP